MRVSDWILIIGAAIALLAALRWRVPNQDEEENEK